MFPSHHDTIFGRHHTEAYLSIHNVEYGGDEDYKRCGFDLGRQIAIAVDKENRWLIYECTHTWYLY